LVKKISEFCASRHLKLWTRDIDFAFIALVDEINKFPWNGHSGLNLSPKILPFTENHVIRY